MASVAQNQPTPNNDVILDQPIEAATPDDSAGQIEAAPLPGAVAAPAPEPVAGEPMVPRFAPDDRRAAIFANHSAKRKAEAQAFSGDMNDPDLLYGADADTSDMDPVMREAYETRLAHLRGIQSQQQGQGEQQTQQAQQQPAPAQQRPAADTRGPLNGMDPARLAEMVPVIVDGRETMVPLSDVIRSHQTQQAADRRLAEAKYILQEAQAIRQQAGNPPPAGPRQEAAAERSHAQTSRDLPANAAELVEKIQMGGPEDFLQAFTQLTEQMSGRQGNSNLDETSRVLVALEDVKARDTVEAFARDNPELATDNRFQIITASFIEQEQIRDLAAAGYTQDQVKEALSQNSLAMLHKYARAQRFNGVRPVDQILTSAHQQAVQWRTGAAPVQANRQPQPPMQTSMAQREARKDQLQTQPQARRMSPQATAAQTQKPTIEQSRKAGFDQIRAARKQTVTG